MFGIFVEIDKYGSWIYNVGYVYCLSWICVKMFNGKIERLEWEGIKVEYMIFVVYKLII